MKKASIILAMAALALGFSSCKQEDEPKYHAPSHFTVNTPALQNQEIQTTGDMTDPATFNLFCSQPDYGYSAICRYSALASLDPDAPVDDWMPLPNENPTSAAMSIKTFELAVAVNKLLGLTDQEAFDKANAGAKPYKVYLKAVCEISAIEGSRIISDNTVSYNNVRVVFAEKKPAWIYINGNVQNPVTGVTINFTAPSSANLDFFDANARLYEPEELIGEKIYTGQFNLMPADDIDPENIDSWPGFRFTTRMAGWKDGNIGSNMADFYKDDVTEKFMGGGYSGKIVLEGQGNWVIYTTEVTPMTIVLDTQDTKIYIEKGFKNVTFTGRTPSFE